MSEPKSVYIFGYSVHSYVVIETLFNAGYKVVGYFDKKRNSDNPFDLKYKGEEDPETINKIIKNDLVFPAVGNNDIRQKLIRFFRNNQLNEMIAIDPTANVSKSANIGLSTFISKNVSIKCSQF